MWICDDCGRKYGDRSKSYAVFKEVAAYHIGICGWCNEEKEVTEDRDYGYPPKPSTKSSTG